MQAHFLLRYAHSRSAVCHFRDSVFGRLEMFLCTSVVVVTESLFYVFFMIFLRKPSKNFYDLTIRNPKTLRALKTLALQKNAQARRFPSLDNKTTLDRRSEPAGLENKP